jgi:hypothetical protein
LIADRSPRHRRRRRPRGEWRAVPSPSMSCLMSHVSMSMLTRPPSPAFLLPSAAPIEPPRDVRHNKNSKEPRESNVTPHGNGTRPRTRLSAQLVRDTRHPPTRPPSPLARLVWAAACPACPATTICCDSTTCDWGPNGLMLTARV